MSSTEKNIHKRSLKNSWKASRALYKEPIYEKGKLVKEGASQESLLQQKVSSIKETIELFGNKYGWIGAQIRPYYQFPDNPLKDSLGRKYVCEYTINETDGQYIYAYTVAKTKKKTGFTNSFMVIPQDPIVGEIINVKKNGGENFKLKILDVHREIKKSTGIIVCKQMS